MNQSPIPIDALWVSFFNVCFEVTEDALDQHWIQMTEIVDQEPYLFFGLTGKTILDAIFRSMDLSGLRISLGHTLTDQNCPAPHRELVSRANEIKKSIRDLNMNSDQRNELRRMTLYQHSDKEFKCNVSLEDRVKYNRIVGQIHAISIVISQLPFFKEQFHNIFCLLTVCRATDTYDVRVT